jgi:hypothetical protein
MDLDDAGGAGAHGYQLSRRAACGDQASYSAAELGLSAKGETTMRTLLILAAIVGFSAPAFTQTAAPKVGGKPMKQVKPLAPMGCKLVGTVKGTKLWAGDCAAASELRGTVPSAETAPPPPPDTGAELIRPLRNSKLPSPLGRLSRAFGLARPAPVRLIA